MIVEGNMTDELIEDSWRQIFERYDYMEKIVKLKDFYPDDKSLYVSFMHISDYSNEFAETITNNPLSALEIGESIISSFLDKSREADSRRVNIRLTDLPERDVRVEIRDIRSEKIGKMLSVIGIIRKRTDVMPRLQNAVFQCSLCAERTIEPQQRGRLEEPDRCSNPECGAERQKARFRLLPDESEFVDVQKLEIQENPETMQGGTQPQRITIILEDDSTGNVEPGDRVIVDGVLLADQKRIGAILLTEYSTYVYAVNLRKQTKEIEDIEVSEEDEEKIKELAKRSDIVEALAKSIAPSIYDMDIIKQTLVLQMFGGVRKTMRDGTAIRGDIHVLIVGDPGTAKSQLLRYMSEISPRGVLAIGRGSSAAGLTAAAVRDDFGEGRWTLEAGVLVLANNGLAAIDELDKMDPNDTSSMHEAMEQQSITISKAGIYATLTSRCSILAAANPVLGRLDPNKALSEQIKFPIPLLSRFDIIFKLTDMPSRDTDTKLADHIIRAHRVGEILREMENTSTEDETIEDEELFAPIIEKELMRKYVMYSKSRIYPKLSKEAMDLIRREYVDTRSTSSTEGIPITARQLESIIRMSEASARARLSSTVTIEDAARARKIVNYYLMQVSSVNGIMDVDIIMTGRSSRSRNDMEVVLDIIKKLVKDKGIADKEEIEQEGKLRGLSEERIAESLVKLKNVGTIFEPSQHRYRGVES